MMPAKEMAMASKAAFFKAALTEDPISALLSTDKFELRKILLQGLGYGIRFFSHGVFRFFGPDDQDVFVGHLLQFQVFKTPLGQSAPDLVQSEGLGGLELGHGPPGKFHPQVGFPAVDLHKGYQTQEERIPEKIKAYFLNPIKSILVFLKTPQSESA